MAWDVTVPASSANVSDGAGVITTMKTDLQAAFRGSAADGTEAKFPGSDTSNPVFRYRGLKGTTAARGASGQYGLYMNTTLNTIQRDNGSSWEDVATLIPSGSKLPWYQSSVPTGWTAVALNDKALRVVTSGTTGGSSGGTDSIASTITLAHTHVLADDGGNIASQNIPNIWSARYVSGGAPPSSTTRLAQIDGTAGAHTVNALQYTTDSQLTNFAFAYADVVIGSKD